MKSLTSFIKKTIFKTLSFKQYLQIISKLYFLQYNLGLLKNNPSYKYHYFLKNIIKPNDVVIDIGANLGYYSKLFSKWVGAKGLVHSVEPVKEIREVLEKNIRGIKNINIYPYALGSENKKIKLGNNTRKERGFIASGSHSVLNDNENAVDEFDAEMRIGSELFAEVNKVDFIKCDVEGYEIYIIPELKGIISKFYPSVLIETRQEKRSFIINFFNDLNYSDFVLKNGLLYKSNTFEEKVEDDILFIHKNRLETYKDLIFTNLV